jgi:predicted transcriptional regulator
MDNEKTLEEIGRRLVAKIVSSYVTHNQVAANELPSVITSVHQAVSGLEKRASSVEPLTPAVPVRHSVRTDYVVCLECGFRSRALRRHLRTQHGLERAEYYARWQLPPDHPIITPGYSARRSALAKELGLGRGRKTANAAPPAESR